MNEQAIAKAVAAAIREALDEKPPHRRMTLALARELIVRVERKAAEMGVKAVVAVSDAGGHPVAVECMDGAYIASYDIAVQKAFTVVALKMPTSRLKELAQPGGPLYGIEMTNGGRIVIFGGGVPLYVGGEVIGGLGVSGGNEAQDTALAEFGGAAFSEGRHGVS